MGGYRKPSVRPMPRRLYRFTTERRTSVNRYLLTVDFPWPRRNRPNSPPSSLLPPPHHFTPRSFFFLLSRCAYPCARLSPPLLRITFLPRFVARSSFSWPSLAFLALLYPSPSLTVLSTPLAVPDVVEPTPAGGVAGGGADRDGRGPGAVVMKTYEIYSIWADAITPPTTILPHSLDPCTLATA